jgi:hypothetical protein
MKYLFSIVILAALIGGHAHASCSYPPPPAKIPDGRTATLKEMLEGQKAVTDYDAAVNEYVKCLDTESADAFAKAGDQLTEKQKEEMHRISVQKQNAAIDQDNSISARFNEQVRIFKGKDKDKDTDSKKKS